MECPLLAHNCNDQRRDAVSRSTALAAAQGDPAPGSRQQLLNTGKRWHRARFAGSKCLSAASFRSCLTPADEPRPLDLFEVEQEPPVASTRVRPDPARHAGFVTGCAHAHAARQPMRQHA
jgi:hypothetical protein